MIILDKDIFAWNRADVNRMTVAVVYPQVRSRTIASEYLCFLQASDQLSDSVSRSDVLLRKTSGADQWNQFKTDLTGPLRWFPVGTDRISWLRKWIRALKAVVFHWCCVVVVFAFRHRHNFFLHCCSVRCLPRGPHGLTFSRWGCHGLRHKPTELAHSFYFVLVSVSAFMDLSTVFRSINSPDNSPLSHSVLLVLFLPFWSFQLRYLAMKVSLSPDVTLYGWLGLKHQLTN